MKKYSYFVAILIVLGLIAFYKYPLPIKKSGLNADQAKSAATKLIEENLVQPGTKFTITDVSEENGLYKLVVNVQNQDITTYMTKDGKKFFPQAIDENTKKKQQQAQAEEQKEIPKKDKVDVDLYVMSFCPFGNKAEDTMKPVYELLKDKVNFNFHYIVSTGAAGVQSLHGAKEVTQNEREACVLKDYGKGKWMDFVTYVNANCGSDGSCWETGAKNSGIDTAKVNSCVQSEGENLMKENETASNSAGAQGSPTMMINGVETKEVYQYGNSEAYKKVICDSFNSAPSECSQGLSSQTSTAQGGSCGN